MKVKFSQENMQELFSNFAKMQKKIGALRAKSIKKQYNRLQAVRTFGDYLRLGLGKPHALTGDYKGCYGVHVDKSFRLIIKPITENGKIEICECEIVCIMKMEDYHG